MMNFEWIFPLAVFTNAVGQSGEEIQWPNEAIIRYLTTEQPIISGLIKYAAVIFGCSSFLPTVLITVGCVIDRLTGNPA